MVVLITDASSSMGGAMARTFAQKGETVILAGKGRECRERLDMLAAELDPASIPIVAELKTDSSVAAAMARLPEGCQSIDVVVNTAGMTAEVGSVSQMQPSDFASVIEAGTHTLVDTIRAVLPFLKRSRGGRILNLALADHEDRHGQPGTYGMTKIMLGNVTRILAEELAAAGIHTTCIVAGYREESASPSNEKSCVSGASGAGRALTLTDIAEAAYWVATQPSHRHVSHIELLPTDLPFVPTPRGQR
jgi:NADP-dependent 3-hydroxy acid dehydrogenase YdfG